MNNNQVAIAYILGVAISLFFLLISAIVSNYAIIFEGGSNPRDKQKRRLWYWIFCVLSVIVTAGVGFIISSKIEVPTTQKNFNMALLIAMGIGLVLYVILGFILSKVFKHGKLGHWF